MRVQDNILREKDNISREQDKKINISYNILRAQDNIMREQDRKINTSYNILREQDKKINISWPLQSFVTQPVLQLNIIHYYMAIGEEAIT